MINMNDITKSEFISSLSKIVLSKIDELQRELQNNIGNMSDNNRTHFQKTQEGLVQNWRKLMSDLKKFQTHSSTKIEDGALVKVSGYPDAEWIFIYKFQSSVLIEGVKIEIDDGKLGRVTGSIHGAHAGDQVKLAGDQRGICDLKLMILKVL